MAAGGFGAVYRAVQDRPRRDVAIKVVRPDLALDPRTAHTFVSQFEREIQFLADLRHPYIVQVYESGSFTEGTISLPYFTMEFLEEEPIQTYFGKNTVGMDDAIELIAKILDGVHYAHLKRVVHRDLKPDNIAVRKIQQSLVPAIRDFSIAASRATTSEQAPEAPGFFRRAGTIAYSSPDRIQGNAAPSPQDDIYSVAVMTFELLTGALPFAEDPTDRVSLTTAIVERRYKPFDTLRRRAGADAVSVIRRALGVSRASLYASAADFAADLRAVCRGDRPSARQATAWDDLWRYARRHRAVVLSAGLAVVATVAGAATTLWQANLAQRHAATAEARSERLATLAQRVIFEITKAAEGLPASTAGRSVLLDRGIAALREIAEASPGDQAIHESLGFALVYLARVLGDPVRPNVGDLDRAKAVAELAIETLAASPNAATDARCLVARAEAHTMLGRMIGTDDPPLALDRFRTAHALSMQLLDLDSRDENGRLRSAHVMLLASQLVLDEARTWLEEELPRTTTRLEAIAARMRAESATISPDEAALDADIRDCLARVAAAIGRRTQATRLVDEAERALKENDDPSAPACTGRLVNLERTRAEMYRAAGEPEKELAQRRRALERASDYASGLPEGASPYLTPIRAALEFAECAVRVQLDADTATLEALRITKAHHDRDPTDAGAKAAYAEAIRYRMSLLEARADGDPELASLRRLLDELLAE